MTLAGNPRSNGMDEEKSNEDRLSDCPNTKNSFWPMETGFSRRRDKFIRSRDPLDVPKDVKRRKILKFRDTNDVHVLGRNLDDSRPSRKADALNYVPKTSELLSCKKLIEEARHKQLKEASNLKNIKIRCSAEEIPKTTELSQKRSIDDEIRGKIPSFQQHNKLRHLKNFIRSSTKEIDNALSGRCKSSMVLLPMEDLSPLDHSNINSPIVKFEEHGGKCRSLDEGDCRSSESIFSEKRRYIIKVAAENLSLQVNELVSKGCNLIPDLLQRLGIANEPNNHYETSKMVQNVVPDYSYYGVDSGSIPQMPSEENGAVATILQGQNKLLEHFSDEDHSLIPSWNQNVENLEYSNLHVHRANTRNNTNKYWLKDSRRMMELFTNTEPGVYFKSYQRLPFNGSFAISSLPSDFGDLVPEDSFSNHHLVKLPLIPFENPTQNNNAEPTPVPMLLEFDEVYSSDEACNRSLRGKSPKLLGGEEDDTIFNDRFFIRSKDAYFQSSE